MACLLWSLSLVFDVAYNVTHNDHNVVYQPSNEGKSKPYASLHWWLVSLFTLVLSLHAVCLITCMAVVITNKYVPIRLSLLHT